MAVIKSNVATKTGDTNQGYDEQNLRGYIPKTVEDVDACLGMLKDSRQGPKSRDNALRGLVEATLNGVGDVKESARKGLLEIVRKRSYETKDPELSKRVLDALN
ncbi:MAG: hypothetical protein V1744_07920 [Candidatus Altiarchaeota archaeon]